MCPSVNHSDASGPGISTGSTRLRAIALGIVWRDTSLLVGEGHDAVKVEDFFRPLGGGITFGERGDEALRREFREELGAEIEVRRQLGTLENIFTYAGRPGHEICLIYEATLRDTSLYERDRLEASEDDGAAFVATWKSLSDFANGDKLYPDGLLALLS